MICSGIFKYAYGVASNRGSKGIKALICEFGTRLSSRSRIDIGIEIEIDIDIDIDINIDVEMQMI